MPHTLYMICGSHPCITAERALQLKRQPYRLVEFPPVLQVPVLRSRFGSRTVPVLRLGGGEIVVGSRAIVHRLDVLVPDPPLLPHDSALRARVEEAERWGDDVLQAVARRLFWACLHRRPDAIVSYSEDSLLHVPGWAQKLVAPALSAFGVRYNRVAAHAPADFHSLPACFDRVDAWIAEGLLGGEQPNAADLQIGPGLRMLGSFGDVQPLLAGRPCWQLAQRIVPRYPGWMPAGALTAAPSSAPVS
jgi:glutathione S-transferase